MYSLAIYMRETCDHDLTLENQNLYGTIFEKFGFTKWHFLQLMERGTIRYVKPGEYIHEECEPIDNVCILLEGDGMNSFRKDSEMGMPSHRLKETDRAKWDAFKTYQAGALSGPCLCGEIWER